MAMPRPKKTTSATTRPGTFPRTLNFDPVEWNRFDEKTTAVGMSPGSLLRKVVIDYNQGLFVNMSRCSPDVITELKKRQAEIKALDIESVVLMILGEWAAARAKKKR
ncbi:MAG: hypothetical protein IT381_32180 [Deltaproteobacteria bacterium]|nr:hypothetical protein [Deltaproteobacteria bacterium]